MTPTVALALYAAPAALIAVALAAHASPGPRPRTLLALARVVTLSVLVAAVAAAGLVFSLGPVTSALLGYHGIGLSLRLDALSTALFVLVSFVGAVVVQFSRNYLDGDGRQAAFVGGLCLALAAVTLLALAGNLLQLVAGWIATSLALHRLLVFYPERPRAINAARKKYLTARLGDACLVIAAVLLYGSFRTADIAAILHAAATTEAASTATGVAAGLIAV
ncbi:MAG: proton-conducting transporter membrane subunit, partial [Ectothiorhodospiraceae bacterium]